MLSEVAQIIVTVDPVLDSDLDVPPERFLQLVERDRDELAAELSLAFEPLRGTLVPGALEIREGSIQIVLHVLAGAAEWTAIGAGVWQMFDYLRGAVTNRVRRFLRTRYGVSGAVRITSSVIVIPELGVGPTSGAGLLDPLQRYLIASHALLTLSLIGVLVALLTKVL